MATGHKARGVARQRVKNARRLKRHGMKPWMKNAPMLKTGMGGTDKSGSVKRSRTYYSQANAEKLRGKPGKWEGIPYRGK